MKPKVRIDVEHVQKLNQEIKAINALELEDIVLFKDGKELKISNYEKEEWKFIGLSTYTFISDL
jgi:hypothetical protein